MDPGKQSLFFISGLEDASPEPVGAQVSVEESQAELTGGLDVGECEKRAREMLGVGRDALMRTAWGQYCPCRVSSILELSPGLLESTSSVPQKNGSP